MNIAEPDKRKAEELASICRAAYVKGYISGTEGNFSVRISDKAFLITPRGFNKGSLDATDMVNCDMNGTKVEGDNDPSTETGIHAMIYKRRDDVNAVCHTHSVFATIFSLAGESFDKAVLPEFVVALGAAPLVPYATPGSERLVENLEEVVGKFDAFLLEKHGPVTLGASLQEAFVRTEMLERYAEVLYYHRLMEKPGLISKLEVRKLLELGGRSDILERLTTKDD